MVVHVAPADAVGSGYEEFAPTPSSGGYDDFSSSSAQVSVSPPKINGGYDDFTSGTDKNQNPAAGDSGAVGYDEFKPSEDPAIKLSYDEFLSAVPSFIYGSPVLIFRTAHMMILSLPRVTELLYLVLKFNLRLKGTDELTRWDRYHLILEQQSLEWTLM